MGETFFNWLNEHYHILFLLLIAIVVTWAIANRYFHWINRVKKTEDICSRIDTDVLPQISNKIDTHILPQITSISTSINNLVVYLKTKDGKLDVSLFRTMSPIQLTALGNEILEKAGGKSFIDTYLEELISSIDAIGIRTALDVQNVAPIVISTYSTKETFNHIKDYIFKNPSYKVETSDGEAFVNLDFNTIANIMGIYLRDKYLTRHSELNPDDIP